MLDALPPRAFFRFEFPLHLLKRTGSVDADLRKFQRKHMLPSLTELDGQPAFADVYFGWNEDGIHVGFDVPNRRGPLECDPTHWWKKDGLRLCIDTRDARDLKRATRFCHFFYMLPAGGGRDGKQAIIGTHRMSRAKEVPAIDASELRVAARVQRSGYTLEAAIPASCLTGWDPAEHPRIGLFYKVKDEVHGSQTLSIGDDLGWNVDPSTWATGVLMR